MSDCTSRTHRVLGALVGSAVGDALGAPFEFKNPGLFSDRFPQSTRGTNTEMCGGGSLGWAPGEFTDDTQMALALALSLLERGGLDPEHVFGAFRAWYNAGPRDVGIQTSAVLGSGRPWDVAAREHFSSGNRAAGNGSLMRATPAAIWFAGFGREKTVDAAIQISGLTHGDPAAGAGCALFHEMVRVALDADGSAETRRHAAIASAQSLVPGLPYPEGYQAAEADRAKWADLLAATWTPTSTSIPNGAVWTALGHAVWALRTTSDFESLMRTVIDLGGDTDTVAAIAGGIGGAIYGIQGIPIRWTSAVHGTVPGHGDKVWRLADLQCLAARLNGSTASPHVPPPTRQLEPKLVFEEGVWAADLDGARVSDEDFAVISLCRLGEPFPHAAQRSVYLVDDGSNCEIDTLLSEILADMAALVDERKRVLVHCHHGASRTGLLLRAWAICRHGLSEEDATALVQQKWPRLDLWNRSFTEALRRLHCPTAVGGQGS